MRRTTPHTSRRSRTRRLAAVLMASTTLVAMTACGSDGKSSDDTDPTTATTEAESETTVTETTPETTEDSTEDTTEDTTPETTEDKTPETTEDTTPDTTDDTTEVSTDDGELTVEEYEQILHQLLLTPEEIGPTFEASPSVAGDGTSPCGVDVEGQHPSITTVGVQLSSAAPVLAMLEEIKVYETEAAAAAAFALATTGFECGSGEGFEFGELTDVSAELGVEAYALTIASEAVEGAVFMALYSDAIVVLQFQKEAGAAEAEGVADPTTISAAAIEKITTSLNG